MPISLDPQTVNYGIGGLVILFFAYRRFNTPVSSRSSTTAFRFHTAAVTYAVLTFAVWLLVTEVGLDLVPHLNRVENPILGALLITGLLPHTPGLDGLDRWVRGRLHTVAAIPNEVRRLENKLAAAVLEPPKALRDQARARMLQFGFSEEEIAFDGDRSSEQLWTCLTALMVRLQAWRSEPRHADFLRDLEDWGPLELRYEALVPKARAFFLAMRDLGTNPADQRFDAVRREYRAVFLEQANELYRRACRVVSHVVLGCHATHRSRQEELAAFGFKIEHRVSISLDQLVAVFLLVFALLAPFITIARVQQSEAELAEAVAVSLMVSFIYSAAVICSVYPRERWQGWAQRAAGGPRPWRFYVVAGAMAAASAGVLSFVTRWALEKTLAGAWKEVVDRSPWLLMAFITAFMLAVLSDDEPRIATARVNWRLLEGVCQACAMVVAGVAVHFLLHLTDLSPADRPQLEQVLPLAGAIGFFLGYFVPTWYRQPAPEPEPRPVTGSLAATA